VVPQKSIFLKYDFTENGITLDSKESILSTCAKPVYLLTNNNIITEAVNIMNIISNEVKVKIVAIDK
jgi:hypothetical protein